MQVKLPLQAERYSKAHKSRRTWQKLVGALACIVAFCTVYALILPAVTLEDKCDIPEHIHTQDCYTQVTSVSVSDPVCTAERLGLHQHRDACYDSGGKLVCGYADFVVHRHDSSCFDGDGHLWCPLPEIETHEHTDACFAAEPASRHTHTDECYTETPVPVCGNEEHDHTEDCYETRLKLTCGFDGSSAPAPICGKEEVILHEHDPEACFDEYGRLICGRLQIVEHVHSDDCFETVEEPVDTGALTCTLPEDDYHTHSALCYGVWTLTCGMEEHIHDEACTASGISGTEQPGPSELPDRLDITEETLFDISEGPAIFIFAAPLEESTADAPAETSAEPPAETPARFARSRQTYIDLKTYIENNGGSFSFTLLGLNNQELPKDDDGNYIVSPDTDYKLTLGIYLPDGIAPGAYQYQLPEGLTVNGGSGTFTLDGVEIGTWLVDDTGLITFTFNDSADNYTDVTISATMGVSFSESETPIDFDGKITVIVKKPPEEEADTELSKWGAQGDSTEREDPGKIYWTIELLGNANSNIPGSTITDSIISGNHTYTESDRSNGLVFMASQRDPVTGEEIEGGWHRWTVPADDPALTWTDTGWTYTIPETVTCKYCGELTLGNENWWYWIQYTSTPDETDTTGSLVYRNHVTADGQETDGWATIKYGQSDAGIIKLGLFQGAENGGAFQWEVSVTIPGRKSDEPAAYFWYLWDAMRVLDDDRNTIGYVTNDMNLSEVEVTYGGQTYVVPRLTEAGADDLFAWDSTWEDDHGDGIFNGRQIDFFHRCDCTEDTCQLWDGDGCDSHEYYYDEAAGRWVRTDFCRCWTVTEDTVFTFRYETDDPAVIEKYGGSGNLLQNEVSLNHKIKDADDSWRNTGIADSEALVPIPGLFKKELTQDYNGYVAKYTITVNEAKLQLTEDGSPLTIHDVMTDTLAYISGSLVITTSDADGRTGTLTYGEDYTVTYDGSGAQTDAAGNPVHVLDIVILHPEAVQYTLNYDAALIIPTGVTGGVKYSNSASITLFGKTITSGSEEKIYADINISAKNYSVQIAKTDAGTGTLLPGAVFGLFNENGGLIASGTTDENGELTFQTNVTQGIILREHTPYYLQELTAPSGYICDDAKHWFLFCDETGSCTFVSGPEGIQVIPGDSPGIFCITNNGSGYLLPETGGPGRDIYIIGVPILTVTAALLLYCIRRRRNKPASR